MHLLLTVTAAVMLFFGAGCLFVPGPVFSMHGVDAGAAASNSRRQVSW